MILKGQLHAHTTLSDGNLSPQGVADIYEGLGFDFIAFTDHDHLLKPSYLLHLRKVKSDLILFCGIELTIHSSMGYVHVNKIDGQNEVLHIFNHPADYNLTLKKTIQCIKEISQKYPLDVVEITHHGFYTPKYDVEDISYPKVAADDSHTHLTCGRGWIEVDCKRNKDAIIKAIKSGDFRNHYIGKKSHKKPGISLQQMQFA